MEYELKYTVANNRLGSVLALVGALCRPDQQYPAATISSIYYDTRDLRLLGEKVNSDYLKTKARLRWYRGEDGRLAGTAWAEAKYRVGSTRSKFRAASAYPPDYLDAADLGDPELLGLPTLLAERGVVVSEQLLPSLLISYTRRRYVEPVSGFRIAVDGDIRMPRANRALLPSALPTRLQSAVIECKGTSQELPRTLQPLFRLGLRKVSFSKYLACHARSHNLVFDPR